MMTTTTSRYWIPSLLLSLLLASVGSAQDNTMAVASNGAIMKLIPGAYGELFPGGVAADSENHVLALDVFHAGGRERFLVPQTESRFVEIPAALHYEKNQGLSYLLWEGIVNDIHPFLYLTAFDGAQWSEVVQITGNVFAAKGLAKFLVMSERTVLSKDASGERDGSRSIIYVTWWEESQAGVQKYLAPVILQGGEYLGWHESLNLAKTLKDGGVGSKISVFAANNADLDLDVEHLLRIQPSAREGAVTVGFMNPDTGRLVVMEFEMLPQELGALAAFTQDLIEEYGAAADDVASFAQQVRSDLLNYGTEFHRGILEHIADQVEATLNETSSVAAATAPGMLEKAGMMIVHIGARARAKGLVDTDQLVEIFKFGQSRQGGGPYHYLKSSLLSDRPAPTVDGTPMLFLSRTGHEALVAWEREGTVHYVETEGLGWSDEQVIQLREGVNRDTAFRILSNRTLNR